MGAYPLLPGHPCPSLDQHAKTLFAFLERGFREFAFIEVPVHQRIFERKENQNTVRGKFQKQIPCVQRSGKSTLAGVGYCCQPPPSA
jgi:hypothetical protein